MEPELTHRVLLAARRQIVDHGDAARGKERNHVIAVPFRLASVHEQKIERRLARQRLAPVALEDMDVVVAGKELAYRGRTARVELDGKKRHLGRKRRHDPRRPDAAARTDLRHAQPTARGSKNVEERPDLGARGELEARLLDERQRAEYERGPFHRF